MRKYATAFTRTGTLSFVITSCGGICSVIVRRSTFTIRSTIGISRKRPGPFGSGKSRPRRKTIPRSYSRATLRALTRNSSSRKSRTTRMTTTAVIDATLHPVHVEREAVESVDTDALAGGERLVRVRAPELTAYEHEAAVAHHALHADDLLRADDDRPAPGRDRLADREGPEAADDRRERDHEWQGGVVRRRQVVEQRREPDAHRDKPGDRERTVCDDVCVDDEKRDAEQNHEQAGPRERQDGEAEERRQEADGSERSGQHDARMEDLVADAGEAGEEEQRDDVRV